MRTLATLLAGLSIIACGSSPKPADTCDGGSCASGVDAAYEAVIVSDGGLNADSALAFLMLEKMGQKKVSVLSDSVDDWGFAGYVVSDCGAVADIFKGHHYSPNPEQGVAAAIKTGMDVICGDYRNLMSTEPNAIIGAVHHGLHELGARVIYGGSVDSLTAGPILSQDGVDGLFVGRAALDPKQFAAIVQLTSV